MRQSRHAIREFRGIARCARMAQTCCSVKVTYNFVENVNNHSTYTNFFTVKQYAMFLIKFHKVLMFFRGIKLNV